MFTKKNIITTFVTLIWKTSCQTIVQGTYKIFVEPNLSSQVDPVRKK